MLLEIRHVTEYHYAGSVRESVMELWMQPQKRTNQRLISFELEIDPAAQLFSYADTFGNAVYHFDIPQPHQRLIAIHRPGRHALHRESGLRDGPAVGTVDLRQPPDRVRGRS